VKMIVSLPGGMDSISTQLYDFSTLKVEGELISRLQVFYLAGVRSAQMDKLMS